MKKLFFIITFVFASIFSYSQSTSEIYSFLKEASVSVNANCPTMVDEITRLDMVNVYEPKTIEYRYTLLKSKSDYSPQMLETMKSYMLNSLSSSVKNTESMSILRDYDVTFMYTYYDKFGNFLFTCTIYPYMYSQQETQYRFDKI